MNARTEFTNDQLHTAPLRHRSIEWRRAALALFRMRDGDYSSYNFNQFAAAMDGNDSEREFQDFLATPNAGQLVRELPNLVQLLDDHEQLSRLPEGSLGRAYLSLALRDGIRIGEFVESRDRLPEECLPMERRSGLRKWHRDRALATHDLQHLLTEYDRDEVGEAAMTAFSAAIRPRFIWWFSIAMNLLIAPKRRMGCLLRFLYRSWKRGRASRIPLDTLWEELLPLPIDEVRRQLRISAASDAHPEGVWRVQAAGVWGPA